MNLWRFRKAFQLLINNPSLFLTKARAKSRLLTKTPDQPIKRTINGVLFEFDFSFDTEIMKMYTDSYEVETIEALKRFLKEGDTFIDVGANIGYMSAAGLGLVGRQGSVHSFEPVPKYVSKLKRIIQDNPEYRLFVNEYALGDTTGTVKIAVSDAGNIGWNSAIPGIVPKHSIEEHVEVPLMRLDDYIETNRLDRISVIKIDAEGYEFPVLKGLSRYFQHNQNRPVIICEITYAAFKLLDSSPAELKEYMESWGYNAFLIANSDIEVDITGISDPIVNVIFQKHH